MKLSVIMPLYNQEKLFRVGLDSIPPQDDIEIIVIDDSSTDNSLSEVRDYQMNSKKNIIVLHNDRNEGVAKTVNRGLDVASGEYIVLLGSDGDYFVNLPNAFDYLDSDLVYFDMRINSGEFLQTRDGSSKFMRKSFIGDTRVPLLINCEDNAFHKLLLSKKPSVGFIDRSIMYKHYNYPREGSLVWQVVNKIVPRGKEI